MVKVLYIQAMQLLILTREEQEAQEIALEAELRRQEAMGRAWIEAQERAAVVTPEPEYAI